MVVNRGDIKRKRKDDSCLSMLNDSPKRTKVHAQRKFAQGSNVSSPVITPVKEIERQDRNKDVLPEPIELLPMKRPNTEDFLTFLCFRGTPILPPNLNFFNTASMIDSRSQTNEPKSSYPKNGPILTTTSTNKSQNERPFIAFGVRKRADPIIISKQMDRKRRHALALQALRRKYQEQKMAKIRSVTISKLSEKVTSKNIVRTRSVTKSESATKKTLTHKTDIKVIATKHITTKTAIKQPLKSKMCLRSFRGRYIHRELNIQSPRKRPKIPKKSVKIASASKIDKDKSSSEFSSDDDEPLMKSVKTKPIKKKLSTSLKKKKPTTRESNESSIRLTRSHNKIINTQSQRKQTLKHRRIITRLSSTIRPATSRLKNKKIMQTSNIIRSVRRTVSAIKREQTQKVATLIQSARQNIIKDKIERNINLDIKQTRSKSDRSHEKGSTYKKEELFRNLRKQKIEELSKRNEMVNKEIIEKKQKLSIKTEKVMKKNNKQKFEPNPKIIRKGDPDNLNRSDNQNENNQIKKGAKALEKTSTSSNQVEKLKVNDEKCKTEKSQNKNCTKELQDLPKHKIIPKKTGEKMSNSRPTRKTKEAAAIYMELLGHKLVNDTEIDDDDISIDSFPELPNVRKTEQRENELKAKIKSKTVDNKNKNKEYDVSVVDKEYTKCKMDNKPDIQTNDTRDSSIKKINNLEKIKPEIYIESITLSKNVISEKKNVIQEERNDIHLKQIQEEKGNTKIFLEDSIQILTVNKEESFDNKTKDECKIYRQINLSSKNTQADNSSLMEISVNQAIKENVNKTFNGCDTNELENDSFSESDNIESNIESLTNKKGIKKVKEKTRVDQGFSDSDEEPLSNLTKPKVKINKTESYEKNLGTIIKNSLKTEKLIIGKPKRECTKKPHNYLPFSSSDDEEKYFHGFVKSELKTLKELKTDSEKCPHSLPSDLSCKDVSRRYGKGKVNMSNEQIEKWLNDSAMAGMNIKKEEEDMLKYEEKMSPIETIMQEIASTNLEPIHDNKSEKKFKNVTRENEETLSLNSTPEKTDTKPLIKSASNERKTIFRKEKTGPIRNVNAFSVSNECSVYAFEADNEDSISTPFRRPCRRPSSTATSKSEDENKTDDISKHSGKFRLPSMLRNDFKVLNKHEISHANHDDSNNTNTTAQTNFENQTFTDNSNSEPLSITEDIDHMFFTANQSPKYVSPEGNGKIVSIKTSNDIHQKSFTKLKLNMQPIISQRSDDKSMFPPSNALPKGKSDKTIQKQIVISKCLDKSFETSEDIKYKIPGSPSTSSSSSTKLYKRQTPKTRNRLIEVCTPINTTEFPNLQSTSQIVEAPTFHPSEKEFQDPLEYIEKIRSKAEKFGICRIVPPANFKPECKVSDDMRFTAYNQYVHKMLHRWGPNFKELMAIKKYLETQNITLTHPPWIGGMEIDLPRLYQTVQSLGGLKEVIEKKKWPKVSEAMKIPKSAQDRVTKLDDIYCKYLLPYDTLSPAEREKLFDEVETEWAKRESKTLLKAQRVSKLDSSNTDIDSDSDNESEECIVKGRNIALNAFYRIARNTMSMWFKTAEPLAEEVEQEFWKHVTLKNNHICVHSGSIDSGNWGYGFAVSKNSPFARHAWNLKVLTNNSGSVLRSMGPIMGVTVPTLHVGMVFSACCWYRDPHSLPWIEYLHTGAHKIWYGIPDSMSKQFHASMLKLVPNYCRNKSIWLPSDTVMIPPKLLVENGVSLCRTVQEPGQFIVVFPKVFTSSVSTGYVVSESVYFAPLYWLQSAQYVFDELRRNCEPSMFSIDRLLLSITSDTRSTAEVLKQIIPAMQSLCSRERKLRGKLHELGLKSIEKLPPPEVPTARKRKKLQHDSGDYECEICRTNLFISLVNEFQEDVIYCLEHVIEYIEQRKVDVKNCKLLFTYECEELDLLVTKIKSTIEIKQQKKISSKVGLSLVK